MKMEDEASFVRVDATLTSNDNDRQGLFLEEGEIQEEEFGGIDDFILGTESTSNQNQEFDEEFSSQKIFDRAGISTEYVDENAELQSLQTKVAVYEADRLENEFIDQAIRTLDRGEVSSSRHHNKNRMVQNLIQDTDEAVKIGNLTPFELLIKKQEDLQKSKGGKKGGIPVANNSKVSITINQRQIQFFRKKKRKLTPPSRNVEASFTTTKSDDEEFIPSSNEDYDEDEIDLLEKPSTSKQIKKTGRKMSDQRSKDDGNENHFKRRILKYKADQDLAKINGEKFDDTGDYHDFTDGYRISNIVWNRLYKYQKTGIRWLYELHSQCVGGILADEMGLGKTIQICVFLRSLVESQIQSSIFKYKGLGPSLIVCPATVLHQWVKEFNAWFPLCKVIVFHSSGAHSGSKNSLLQKIVYRKEGSILITSYSTYILEYKKLLKIHWHYVILDEGHKIRNPETKITLALKELRTPHRIIMSGSPLQNNLKELWSLIDFIYPGRLGSLKEFMVKFSIPITQGGYANATAIQVRTAYKCACILRDAINPYLLRRMKKNVQMILNLPEKTEQILFCDITDEQRVLYLQYIESKACQDIIYGTRIPFVGLMHLRKLCNHPDLVTGGPNKYGDLKDDTNPELQYGAYQRSGKMIVVQTLLRLWFKQGQKVLLFSQSRQMLTIIEGFVLLEGYEYLRMDGTTPIGQRQSLVENFNENNNIFIFLLTTRVGGLGVNLTGANRVLIYDPDWNPSTDTQARERAWRIGQNRSVTIYRLMTSGTIEEKIYQRQIFKHFLTNRVLANPKQQRFFKTNDLHELFTLGAAKSDKKFGTETAVIFSANAAVYDRKNTKALKENETHDKQQRIEDILDESLGQVNREEEQDEGQQLDSELTEGAREKLRRLARKMAKNYELTKSENENGNSSKIKRGKKSLFEGRYKVPMLRKQKALKSKDLDEELEQTKKQDDYVLQTLLSKKTGVHSALQHDHIVQEGSSADIQLVEDEANAVARRAADVLKNSRRIHQTFLENVSEFSNLASKKKSIFGRKRAAGFNDLYQSNDKNSRKMEEENNDDQSNEQFDGSILLKKKKSLSSGIDLLRSIEQRKEQQLNDDQMRHSQSANDHENEDYPSLSAQTRVGPLPFGDKYEKLADEIRNFLVVNNGRAKTDEILCQFKNRVPSSEIFIFRAILKRICKLTSNSQWILRDEFA